MLEIRTNETDSKCEHTASKKKKKKIPLPFFPSPSLGPATPKAHHRIKCSLQLPIIQSTGVDT